MGRPTLPPTVAYWRSLLAILEAVEGTDEHGTALAAIREARRNLELIGEVSQELDVAQP